MSSILMCVVSVHEPIPLPVHCTVVMSILRLFVHWFEVLESVYFVLLLLVSSLG